jgi:hypothetical protein
VRYTFQPRALVAQLDRASVYETEGRWFESNRAHQFSRHFPVPSALAFTAAFPDPTAALPLESSLEIV